jgi:Protein of unknown function (DUF2892)
MFAKNVGGLDRILRIVAGLALTLIGVVPLLTGLMSSCPLYSIMGLSTCPVKRA